MSEKKRKRKRGRDKQSRSRRLRKRRKKEKWLKTKISSLEKRIASTLLSAEKEDLQNPDELSSSPSDAKLDQEAITSSSLMTRSNDRTDSTAPPSLEEALLIAEQYCNDLTLLPPVSEPPSIVKKPYQPKGPIEIEPKPSGKAVIIAKPIGATISESAPPAREELPCCLLCRRKFRSTEQLTRHELHSDLHKKNIMLLRKLAKYNLQ